MKGETEKGGLTLKASSRNQVNHCIKYVAVHIMFLKEEYGMKSVKITE